MPKRNLLHLGEIDLISLVDRGDNPEAHVMIHKRAIDKAPTKAEGDGKHYPASDYAYVPDRDKSSTWKLRLTSTPGGEPDTGIVGAAVAALGSKGFRGQPVKIPASDRPAVVKRVRAAWLKANPEKGKDDLPSVLKKGVDLKGGGDKIDTMDSNKKERVTLLKQIADYFGIGKDDLTLDEEEIVDKEAEEKIRGLEEKVEGLEKGKATADAISAAVDGISKAKTPDEVDAVLAKIEDTDAVKGDEIRAAVADEASDRKTSFEKAAGEEEVKAFRARLPDELQDSFDKLDEPARAKFMKSFNDPGEDPVAKALEALTKANEALVEKVEKLEGDSGLAAIEKELKSLVGKIKSVPETAKAIVALRKIDAAAADSMLEEYRALAKQAEEKGGVFDIIGKDEVPGGDSIEKIEKAAAALRKADPKLTEEQAVAKAVEDNPELYDEHLEDKEGK